MVSRKFLQKLSSTLITIFYFVQNKFCNQCVDQIYYELPFKWLAVGSPINDFDNLYTVRPLLYAVVGVLDFFKTAYLNLEMSTTFWRENGTAACAVFSALRSIFSVISMCYCWLAA